MFFKNKKNFLKFLVPFCFLFFLVFNLAKADFKDTSSFYQVSLYYDSKTSLIKLDEQAIDSVSLGNYNFTNDSGEGSTFYAKVKNFKNEYNKFKNQEEIFYLGKFKIVKFTDSPESSTADVSTSGPVSISIPYFQNGKTIEIYDVTNDKLALTIDVSKFAKDKSVGPDDDDGDDSPGIIDDDYGDDDIGVGGTEPINPDNGSGGGNFLWLFLGILLVFFALGLLYFIKKRQKNY